MAVSSTQIPVEEQKTCPHFHLLYSVIKKEATETELWVYNKQMVAVRRKAAFVQGKSQCSHISVQNVRLNEIRRISVHVNNLMAQFLVWFPFT